MYNKDSIFQSNYSDIMSKYLFSDIKFITSTYGIKISRENRYLTCVKAGMQSAIGKIQMNSGVN